MEENCEERREMERGREDIVDSLFQSFGTPLSTPTVRKYVRHVHFQQYLGLQLFTEVLPLAQRSRLLGPKWHPNFTSQISPLA